MNKAMLRDKAKLRVSVAKFAGKVDRLREEADRLHESGSLDSNPNHFLVASSILRSSITHLLR